MWTEQDSHIRAAKIRITTGGLLSARFFFSSSLPSTDGPYFAVQVMATREESTEFTAKSQKAILHVSSNIKVPDEFRLVNGIF